MDKSAFIGAIAKIWAAYDLSKLPNDKSIDVWFRKVEKIPEKAVDHIIDYITDMESKPRNMAVAFCSGYSNFCRENPNQRNIAYDAFDDPRFPIDFLWKAYRILKDGGEESFLRYCQSVGMPQQDIERVRNKYHYAYSLEDLQGGN